MVSKAMLFVLYVSTTFGDATRNVDTRRLEAESGVCDPTEYIPGYVFRCAITALFDSSSHKYRKHVTS